MIYLKRLKLNNFLSHANTELVFLDNTKLLLDGKSGNGKSAIPEALIWCLYGEARTDNRNLVKHGEKNASVLVELFDESSKTIYRIERKTTNTAKNTLSILEAPDGNTFQASKVLGIKDSQNFIEKKLLHASYELFINSVAIPQDNVNSFVKQTASKRKDLLLEIASAGDFDKHYEKAKDLLTEKNEKLIKNDSIIEQKKEFIKTQELSVVEKKPVEDRLYLIGKAVEGHLLTIKEGEKVIEDNKLYVSKQKETEKLIETYNNIGTSYEKRVKTLEKTKEDIKNIDIGKIEKEIEVIEKLVSEHDLLEKSITSEYERQGLLNSILADRPTDRDYESEITKLEENLKQLRVKGNSCPSGSNCPFLSTIQTQIALIVEQIQEKQAKRDKLAKEQLVYTEKIKTVGLSKVGPIEINRYKELKGLIKKLPSLKNDLSNATTSIFGLGKIEDELTEVRALIVENNLAVLCKKMELDGILEILKKLDIKTITQRNEEVKSLVKILESEREELKIIILKSDNAEEIIRTQQKEIVQLQLNMKGDKMEVEQLELIKEAFGSKGLKTIVVDYLIPRLEDRINEILGQLSDLSVRLDTQRTSADGEGTVEGLYINITNPFGQEVGFDNYSGGEKIKITIAISEALASLQKCSFRILDEAVMALDKESTESLVKVLGKIQERFGQLICISHLDEVKDIFEDRKEVIKINGTSIIK